MKTIKKTYKIAVPQNLVWKALVDPEIIDKWGGGPSQMNSKVGFQFQLWGGDIHGKNIVVKKENKLVQEWFGGNWSKPSIATFTLKMEDDETVLELVHEDVPDEDADDIDEGWDEYYLGPMKKMLEGK